MPPKKARKSVGPGRRGGRTRGTATKAAAVQPDPVTAPTESVKPVEEPVEPIEDEKEEAMKVEDVIVEDKNEEKVVADNAIDRSKREDSDVKISVEEYENGERLDLDDNNLEESEPEEYVGDDYDEKESVEDVQDEEVHDDYDVEEQVEEEEVCEEEEDGDIHEGEIEEATEELNPEEDEHEHEHEQEQENEHEVEHKHVTEEHVEMVDEDEEEHHDVFKERRKRKEFEIFVGGLEKDATEEDLRKVFSAVGEVSEVRLMMNTQTKKNKGFAFIRFATVQQAKRACVELKNPVVHGKKCGVTPSHDSDTLFLGNICKTWTKEALIEKLKNYGIDTVEDLSLVEENKTDGTNKGYAFLEFSSRANAMDAFKRLQKRDVTFGVDRPAKVSFADSFADPGDDIMSQVKTVFVDGLPASWDEARVRKLLSKYGNVEKIELARNMPFARRKDYGFITFGTHDEAVTCINNINNEELGEGKNKAKVRARLSRPDQKDKRKHVSRGDFRPGRPASGGVRSSWARSSPRDLPLRDSRRANGRLPHVVDRSRRPVSLRDRRPAAALPPRRPVALPPRRPVALPPRRPVARPPRRPVALPPRRPVALPPRRSVSPVQRSYERRPPVPSQIKNSMKRAYSQREDLPPRSRVDVEYGPPRNRVDIEYGPPRSSIDAEYGPPRSRVDVEYGPPRSGVDVEYDPPRSGVNVEYGPPRSTRGPTYADLPRGSAHSSSKRAYIEGDDYPTRFERPPSYRERHPRDYESVPGSKRPYAALDDVRPHYDEAEPRQTRARMDYDMGGGSSQYGEGYGDRLGRSNIGYGSNRSPISAHDSHGVYSSSRQGMSYSRGSYNGSDSGGMYSSSYGGDYISRGNGADYVSRGSDVGGSSYSSSMYSGRSVGGNGYMGSGSSGSYY